MAKLTVWFSILCLVSAPEQVAAEPTKCVIDGKTLYTDDPVRCGKAATQPIKGSLVVGSPSASPNAKSVPRSDIAKPVGLDGILQHLGLTQQEVADGWKTVMDAHKRGSWQTPDMPEEGK